MAGLVTGVLSGVMYWAAPVCANGVCPTVLNSSGVLVSAHQGDFDFSASNLAVNIGAFAVSGSVVVGDVSATPWASLTSGLTLDNRGSPAVSVTGSFAANGKFTFSGTGQAKFAGFGDSLAVSASNSTGPTVVTGSTAIQVAEGPDVSRSGSFTKSGAGVATNLTGSADFKLRGFDLGTASFGVAVAPGSESFSVSAPLSLGGVFSGQLSGTFASINNQAGFSINVATGIAVPTVAVTGALLVTNMSGSAIGPFSAKVSASYSWNGITFSVSTPVATNWSFSSTSTNATANVTFVNTTNGASGSSSLGQVSTGTQTSLIACAGGWDSAYEDPNGNIEVAAGVYASGQFTVTNLNLPATLGSYPSIFYG